MVARQEWYAAEVRSQRHRQPVRARRPSRREKLAARLGAEWPNVVCIQGEANAWPARTPDRPEPEIVHWVAHRPSTGESYAAVIAPRRALAPSTPRHIALSDEQLRAGGSIADWQRTWRAFVRPGDLLVQWGRYYSGLAAHDGIDLDRDGATMDLRPEVSQMLKKHLGTVDECVSGLGLTALPVELDGRAGRRLAALVTAVSALRSPSARDGQGGLQCGLSGIRG